MNESGFHFDGHVNFRLSTDEPRTFEGAMICGYTETGEQLFSQELGSLTTPFDTAPISVHSDQVPAYITVDHPRFRDYDGFSPETYVRISDGTSPSYRHTSKYLEEVQREFPYPRSDLGGECG